MGTWGRRLGVAQGSIREPINLLAQEGFITKVSGRSARVVSLNEQDVLQLYELRGALAVEEKQEECSELRD